MALREVTMHSTRATISKSLNEQKQKRRFIISKLLGENAQSNVNSINCLGLQSKPSLPRTCREYQDLARWLSSLTSGKESSEVSLQSDFAGLGCGSIHVANVGSAVACPLLSSYWPRETGAWPDPHGRTSVAARSALNNTERTWETSYV